LKARAATVLSRCGAVTPQVQWEQHQPVKSSPSTQIKRLFTRLYLFYVRWGFEQCARRSSDLDFRLSGEGLGPRCFLDSFPAVVNEYLLGDCGFVYDQVEYLLPSLEFRRKSLDVHPLLPERGSYFARQSGALGNPKLKLFHLRHDSNRIYETRRLKSCQSFFFFSQL
jgi:hypothetical protein